MMAQFRVRRGAVGAVVEQSGLLGISVRRRRYRAVTGLRRLLAAFLLSAIPAAAFAGLRDAEPAVLGTLENPVEAVRYANAMADCAGRILATLVVGCDLVPSELEKRHSFWIWRSDTGATVSRTFNGDYRVRSRSCLGGFCSWFSCRVTEWPALTCSDGGKRQARVPGPSQFNIGGTDYVQVRQLP